MARRHADLIQTLVHQNIIKDERIRNAMLATDRSDFSPDHSYQDSPQPSNKFLIIQYNRLILIFFLFFAVGYNVTISAPHMHAYALEMLRDKLVPGARILDVGSGSGYLTACMARLVQPGGKVIGIEHIPELVDLSLKNISRNGYSLVQDGTLEILSGDGRLGYPQGGPYDGIHVGAAAPDRPVALIEQLKPGGRLVVPVGVGSQTMMIYEKSLDGREIREKATLGVRYVPLTDKSKQLRH
jgi:protein-L-isoaspartate(D-aspartate) O-methyltransferase